MIQGLRTAWLATLFAAFSLHAASMARADAQVTVLQDRLRVADLIAIMQAEGADYAETLRMDMLSGQGGATWQAQVADIYDATRMLETVRPVFEAMDATTVQQINLFYSTSLGARIADLEVAGRRAMQDEDIKDAAKAVAAQAQSDNTARYQAITAFIADGDMIERNVAGALRANYRFYRAMVDGGAFAMTEDEIIAEAWAQEEAIRTDVTEWLTAYLMLSLQPLSDADLDTYRQFLQTGAGRALNAALFEGFDQMYADISYALGRAVALHMGTQDL